MDCRHHANRSPIPRQERSVKRQETRPLPACQLLEILYGWHLKRNWTGERVAVKPVQHHDTSVSHQAILNRRMFLLDRLSFSVFNSRTYQTSIQGPGFPDSFHHNSMLSVHSCPVLLLASRLYAHQHLVLECLLDRRSTNDSLAAILSCLCGQASV